MGLDRRLQFLAVQMAAWLLVLGSKRAIAKGTSIMSS
jgi:hypothetical protein